MTIALGVLVSGSGSNLQAIIDRVGDGSLDADIRIVIANKPDAQGLERARKAGIATACVRHDEFPERESFDRELVRLLREAGAGLVALAGFMRILTPWFVERWLDRLINIHPSLLPSFPGIDVHEHVIAYGSKLSGCTVHFVRAEMDHGPIIVQAAVPVYSGDTPETLAARVLDAEHKAYPAALKMIADNRVNVVEEKTFILDEAPSAPSLFNPKG